MTGYTKYKVTEKYINFGQIHLPKVLTELSTGVIVVTLLERKIMINFLKQIFDNKPTIEGDKVIMRNLKGTNLVKVKNQKSFLESYLRGTGRVLSAAQAKANYGIQQLPARISELRSAGMKVKTAINTAGNTVYRISARDTEGSRAKKFA